MSEALNNKILSLSEDSDFIKWVQSEFSHNNAYWQEQREGVDADAIESAIAFVKGLNFKSIPVDNLRQEKLFDRITDTIESENAQEEITINPKRTFRIWPFMAAASLALLAFLFWPTGDLMQVHTDYAEVQNLDLPDNSKVSLNADSKVVYDNQKFTNSRTVKLEGEAFFEVEKGSKFTVVTPLGKVEVLGTSFNVFTRDGRFEVQCVTGKVKVSSLGNDDSVVLTKGESCKFKNGKRIQGPTDANGSWRQGLFNYSDASLDLVWKELERQFAVNIDIRTEVKNKKYTGFFENGDLEKALQSVLWPMGLKYTIEDNEQVVIEADNSFESK